MVERSNNGTPMTHTLATSLSGDLPVFHQTRIVYVYMKIGVMHAHIMRM